jgi:hypothetical protein
MHHLPYFDEAVRWEMGSQQIGSTLINACGDTFGSFAQVDCAPYTVCQLTNEAKQPSTANATMTLITAIAETCQRAMVTQDNGFEVLTHVLLFFGFGIGQVSDRNDYQL